MNQTIFCIAGMHRSGSSMFANWLHHCGVFIGNDFLGPASTNEKGHFEDLDFLNLHVEELKKNHMHISGLYGNLERIGPSDDFKSQAKAIFQARSSHETWGWKEPRTTLFLEKWKEMIPNLKVLIIIRDRDKVVDSLYKRLRRNKWYVSYNPVKKLWWYIDIDLRPKKWDRVFKNTCLHYEKSWKNFQSKYPKDVLAINLQDFIKEHPNVVTQINNFLSLELPNNQLNQVFDRNKLN